MSLPLTDSLFSRISVGQITSLDGTQECAQLQETRHDTLVKRRARVLCGIRLRKLGQELFHRQDDRQDTLVETEQETTHTGGESGRDYDPVGEDISKSWKKAFECQHEASSDADVKHVLFPPIASANA
jgi:hypothetical protein